jgi:LPXTG-site transpeptidase (sortase) family protein
MSTKKSRILRKSKSHRSISLRPKLTARRIWLLAGVMLMSIGIILGGLNLVSMWWDQKNSHVQAKALKNSQPVKNPDPLITGTPVHITIPNVGIDLSVIPGYYYPSDQSWTLSLDNAQWGTMTAKPNNKSGDTYIYAHYRLHVFYTLPHVKPGDEAVVTTDNGHVFTYKFVNSSVTVPTDTSLFNYKGKPILVLQTCTGVWYQYRQLFIFDLTDVK